MAEVPSIWQWPREAGDVRVLGCQSASLFGLSRSRTRPALPPCDRVWLQISLSGCRSSLRDRLPVGGRLQDAGSELHAEQQLFAASPGCSQAGSLQADQRRASPGISQAVGEAPVRGGPRDGLCRLLLRGAQECGYGLCHPLRRRLDLAISQMGVTQRGPHIGMTKQAGDHRHRHAVHHCVAGMGMPEIVKANTLDARLAPGAIPERKVSAAGPGGVSRGRKNEGACAAWPAFEDPPGLGIEGNGPRPRLAVGKKIYSPNILYNNHYFIFRSDPRSNRKRFR